MTPALPAATQAWIKQTITAGSAANTRRAYDQDVRFFTAWARARYGKPPALPLSETVALVFVADCLGAMPAELEERLLRQGHKARPGPLTVRSVQRRLTGLQDWHTRAGLAGPFRAPRIRQLLRRAQRLQAQQPPRRSRPITWAVLTRLLATCGPDLTGLRDRALLLVGFLGGGRRRSELSALEVEDVTRMGTRTLLTIRTSKTDPLGRGLYVPLTPTTVEALEAWWRAAGITQGRVFRAIDRHGNVKGRLSPAGINGIIKARARLAGLTPEHYSAHGLRSGFLTECELRGLPIHEAMALSGHASATTAIEYWRSTGSGAPAMLQALEGIATPGLPCG